MIKIMVDSASDLRSADNVYDYFVPIAINIDGKEYLDGIDIDNDTFYNLLTATDGSPHTSQPSLQSFITYFEQVKEAGDELIYFALSSELSGTYQGAIMAKEMVEYDNIYIIDSKTATHLIGILAKYAVALRGQGLSVVEIVEKCEAIKSKIRVYAGLDTLEYLRRGGRLSNASAVIGTLAQIKPIVTITTEGKVESIGKALGKGKAIQFIRDKLATHEIDQNFPICSVYTYGEENCEALENRLLSEGYAVEKRLQVGSTIGTHVGPGGYGVIFVEK